MFRCDAGEVRFELQDGRGPFLGTAATARAGVCRPRLGQTVRGGLSSPPGTMPLTCLSPTTAIGAAKMLGEWSARAVTAWTAWQAHMVQQSVSALL